MNRRRRTAYTLVEILVAATILSIVIVVVWRLFEAVNRMSAVSTWQSARQTELRTGLQMVREDLQQACYPTVITRFSSQIVDQGSTGLSYKAGPYSVPPDEGTYLEFWVCKPSRSVGTTEDTAGNRMKCTLTVEGRNLRYSRQNQAGGDPDVPDIDRVIIHDVQEMDIQLTSVPSAEYTMNFCTIAVTCQHPRPGYEKTRVTQRTGTKVEVAFDASL